MSPLFSLFMYDKISVRSAMGPIDDLVLGMYRGQTETLGICILATVVLILLFGTDVDTVLSFCVDCSVKEENQSRPVVFLISCVFNIVCLVSYGMLLYPHRVYKYAAGMRTSRKE
jgi:hypothetical protein